MLGVVLAGGLLIGSYATARADHKKRGVVYVPAIPVYGASYAPPAYYAAPAAAAPVAPAYPTYGYPYGAYAPYTAASAPPAYTYPATASAPPVYTYPYTASSTAAAPVAGAPVAAAPVAAAPGSTELQLSATARATLLADLRKFYDNPTTTGGQVETGMGRLNALRAEARQRYLEYRSGGDSTAVSADTGELSKTEENRLDELVDQVVREAQGEEAYEAARRGESPGYGGYYDYRWYGAPAYYQPPTMYYQPLYPVAAPRPHHKKW